MLLGRFLNAVRTVRKTVLDCFVSAHTSKTLSSIRTYKRATLLLYSMVLAATVNADIRLSEGLA